MSFALILASIAAGLIATLVMVVFLYLPLLWSGDYYDVLGAIGSTLTKEVDARARFIGAALYFLVGILFALLYGWLALTLLRLSPGSLPQFIIFPASPVKINLLYPLLGLAVGLGHGIFAGLIMTVLVEHHPIRHFRTRYILIISQVISHLAYGFTVMFFQSQFLQLLLGRTVA